MVKEYILFQGNTTKLTRNEHVALNGAGGGTVGEWRNREGQGGWAGCVERNDMTSPLTDDFFILKRRSLFTEGSNSRGRAAASLEERKRIFTPCWPLKQKSKTSDSDSKPLLYGLRKRRRIWSGFGLREKLEGWNSRRFPWKLNTTLWNNRELTTRNEVGDSTSVLTLQ